MKGSRSRKILRPDASRVLFRPFDQPSNERIIKIIARVMALEEHEAKRQAELMLEDFADRHTGLREHLLHRYRRMEPWLVSDGSISEERKLLIGAYFTQEYALEAAALFNPSIVPHPSQEGVPEGGLRFVLSLRATGEGHISSIVFREGLIQPDGRIVVDPPSPISSAGEADNPPYDKKLFGRKLKELGLNNEYTREVLAELEGEHFSYSQLEAAIAHRIGADRFVSTIERESAAAMRSLARANYQVTFDSKRPISERVIFPYSPNELKGIEDARFVQFVDEDGSKRYYATYTAFSGHTFVPQFIETEDFVTFKINTLNGPEAVNKGLALFPRKINGHYAMISRQDNENLFIMYSDMLHFWYEREIIMRPTYDWEFVQMGNCGSPIETEKGWLMITHGVGHMRRYCIGAALLDLEDPSKVIGRTRDPILSPNEKEREGYVPNVVYSCGGLIHNGRLILPYALSDQCSSFATFDLQEVLSLMK